MEDDIFGQQPNGLNPNAQSFVPSSSLVSSKEKKKKYLRGNKSYRKAKKKRDNRRRNKHDDANNYKVKREFIIIQSQNIHGLYESDKDEHGRAIRGKRTYVKLELIRNLMIKKGIDIYLIQEIWHEGTNSRDIGDGFVLFHHNTTRKQDRTGVGIILSPRMVDAWRQSGGNEPRTIDKGIVLVDTGIHNL